MHCLALGIGLLYTLTGKHRCHRIKDNDMMLTQRIESLLDSIDSEYASRKIVILHPETRYRNLLVSELIRKRQQPVFYKSVGSENSTLQQFLTELVEDIREQEPDFGRHLGTPSSKGLSGLSPEELAAALGKDLKELSQDSYLLVLDEFDRISANAQFQAFFEELVKHLPENCHLMINGRKLPSHRAWHSLVAEQEAVIIGDNGKPEAKGKTTRAGQGDSPETNVIEVSCFGPGEISVGGILKTLWEGHLPRLLMFFLLERPYSSRAEICSTFWPDASNQQAVNIFHVTKRRLHKGLGLDVLQHKDGVYGIKPEIRVIYKGTQFKNELVQARQFPQKSELHYKRVVDLYTDAYLFGYDDDWIKEQRSKYCDGYVEALVGLAQATRGNKSEAAQALQLLLQASEEAPNREDIHRQIMTTYADLGRRSEAVKHYQKLVETMQNQYGIAPSPETQAIYQGIVDY